MSKRDETPGDSGPATDELLSCPSCDSLVERQARYCRHCGVRIEEVVTPDELESVLEASGQTASIQQESFENPEIQRLATDLCNQHSSLVVDFQRQGKRLLAGVRRCGKRLDGLEEKASTPERTGKVHKVLEELEDLGDRAESLQFEYNRRSEVIDEEFSDRCADLELDVEIPGEIQKKLMEAVRELVQLFSEMGEELETQGSRGNRSIARARGRWFGSLDAPRFRLRIAGFWILCIFLSAATFMVAGVSFPVVCLGLVPVLAAALVFAFGSTT